MVRRTLSIPGVLALLATATSIHAHHSWSGVYNSEESITIRGVVTEFSVRSPHLALKLDVRNDAGEIEQWTVEWGSPRRLFESGYDENVFKPGDEVVVTGQPPWTPGRKSVRMRSLTRPVDGFTLGGRRGNER